MNFTYKKIPVVDLTKHQVVDYVYRPIIKIGIKGRITVDYEVLIDSGADDSVFPEELAQIAGIELDKSSYREFKGLGGGSVRGYRNRNIMILNLGGHEFSADFYFCKGFVGYGILGQKGFFNRFRVRFLYSKKRIEIEPEINNNN
jgi:hypothetical protein